VCPHHWDEGCFCRKPNPGMFFQAAKEHLLRMDRTIFVGDDPRDALAAGHANCESILIGPHRSDGEGEATRSADSLLEMEDWIVERFERWEALAAEPPPLHSASFPDP
jgi:histidinol phosphatase-like enzyme